MLKFELDKERWYRGAGDPGSSALLRSDGKQCCIGQLASSCGLADASLRKKSSIDSLGLGTLIELPRGMRWLGHEEERCGVEGVEYIRVTCSDAANECYSINDDPDTTDDEKIALLKPIFAANGIELVVKGET